MKTLFSSLTLLGATLVFTQCTAPQPYSLKREQYRSQSRDYMREEIQRAFERGEQDGRMDYNSGESQDDQRHFKNFSAATRSAYQDGYNRGYGNNPSSPPGYGSGAIGDPRNQTADPVYNQGYDYGLRDRVAGRPKDPGAHAGSYDPRFRRSFERGYLDAYEANPGR